MLSLDGGIYALFVGALKFEMCGRDVYGMSQKSYERALNEDLI